MPLGSNIEEADVSLAGLTIELERACIASTPYNDTSIYIDEPGLFPMWISLKKRERFIYIWTYLEFSPQTESHQRLEFCNELNARILMPAFYIQEGEPNDNETPASCRLIANHVIYYRDGIFASHFIRLCRQFSSTLFSVQRDFDPKNEILQNLP